MRTIAEYVDFDMKWYRRLWRWLIPLKDYLTKKEILEAIKMLHKNAIRPNH